MITFILILLSVTVFLASHSVVAVRLHCVGLCCRRHVSKDCCDFSSMLWRTSDICASARGSCSPTGWLPVSRLLWIFALVSAHSIYLRDQIWADGQLIPVGDWEQKLASANVLTRLVNVLRVNRLLLPDPNPESEPKPNETILIVSLRRHIISMFDYYFRIDTLLTTI